MVMNRSCSAAPISAGGWPRIQAGMAVSTMPGRRTLTVTPVPASFGRKVEGVGFQRGLGGGVGVHARHGVGSSGDAAGDIDGAAPTPLYTSVKPRTGKR